MGEHDKNPFFSVILPVYNKEKYISRSIQSIIDQKFRRFELLIVCDPSTDDSRVEVERFTDERIRVFHRNKPGPGGYAARNLGIMESRAEWIAFLDADDEWNLDHLDQAYQKICHYNVNFLSFGYRIIKSGVVDDRVYGKMDACELYKRNKILEDMSEREIFHTNSVVIKRQSLIEAGCFPAGGRYKRGGDVDTWLRIALNEEQILICSTVTSMYHLDGSGVVSDEKNSKPPQPVVDTVKKIVNAKDHGYEKLVIDSLKRLSNRKQIAMMVGMKTLGELKYRDLACLYFLHLSFMQLLRLFALYVMTSRSYNSLAKLMK